MPAAPASHEPPRHPLPDWYDLLKAQSFADGQAKFKTYLQNAADCIALAGTDPRDPELFWDTKYSSAAGQYGYLAAMMLVDGFMATWVRHKPVDALLAPDRPKPNRWDLLKDKGLGGRLAYNTLLKHIFGHTIYGYFDNLYAKLHVSVHYTLDPNKDTYMSGLQQLMDFEIEFSAQARQLLADHGITDWA